jgi:8-oxo-dGTP diphosphatase
VPTPSAHTVPTVPASASALIFDRVGRLLVLKPTYKSGWTLPGGEMEDTGESPWEACRREVREECGLRVETGRLVCVDFRTPGSRRRGGVRFLFDCGRFEGEAPRIEVPAEEIADHRWVPVAEALDLLRKPVRRRVGVAVTASACVYLEDGRPVPGVG